MKIQFEQLSYHVNDRLGCWSKNEKKTILKQINGEFRGGELSAIMGPSGSGKTTLLNILSGFTVNNRIEGTIKVNGIGHDSSAKQHATYIMQEEHLFPLLTVLEAMQFAVKFKIGNAISEDESSKKIMKTLMTLGLEGKINDFCKSLSGGQKKRLAIALELVDDPSIIFLDEPTTGLDSSSSTLCIQFLKKLAKEGRAIVCTIHQPSSLMFEMFDLVYALAQGSCIYQGSSKNLVPFLSDLDMICPETYSPSDYLLEIANGDYGNLNNCLSRKIHNGMNSNYRGLMNVNNFDENHNDVTKHGTKLSHRRYATSIFQQFLLLLKRNFIFMYRKKFVYEIMRIVIHFVVAIMMGLCYFNASMDASFMTDLYRFSSCAVVFCAYSGFYSLMVRFPLERPTIKREHFNVWYSSTSYYTSLLLSDMPVTIISSGIFAVISYIMTHQPPEWYRFGYFVLLSAVTSFVAQAHGVLIGSIFELKATLIAASLLTGAHTIASGTLILLKDTPKAFQYVFDTVYLKHSIDASATVVLGFDRAKFECNQMYCHFQSPKKFLQSVGLVDNISKQFTNLMITFLIVHFISFCVMRYRLKN